MSNFLMGLFVVQLLLVVYQFTYLVDAGRPESNARATRLGPALALSQLWLSVLAALLWVGWKAYGNTGFAWATFVTLVVAVLFGTRIAQLSLREPPEIESTSPDPADRLTAESRLPVLSQLILGAAMLTLTVLVFFVAIGAL